MTHYYDYVLTQVSSCNNISIDVLPFLARLIDQTHQQDKYSKPMPWIGMYIALASLICILAMVADLFHGIRDRKLWFPCKYFTLNAASLSVIAVGMKLPMDLNNPMPGVVDQITKLGSMAFMCTMMANFFPSLATMDNKELVTNIIALDVLVITLVVNVCIEMKTGVVSFDLYNYRLIAIIYVIMLLLLLIIHTCSALTILKSKQILELKYQQVHDIALKDLELQQQGRVTVQILKQHVSNHWMMARTGSPQFIIACSATSSASGMICSLSTVIHIINTLFTWRSIRYYGSEYKWSISVILITQFTGIVVGSISPLSRCFASLTFKLSNIWFLNHIRIFKVESYWTQEISDWKQSSIPISLSTRKCKIVIQNMKILILNLCIGFQKTVVVTCKIVALIPIFFSICVLHCWKWLKVMFSASVLVSVNNPEQLRQGENFSEYVLKLQDNMELAERTLKGIANSVNLLIQKAEKHHPCNLMKLLEESRGFEGVVKYDRHHGTSLRAEEYLDCWSLALITLTTITISLPNIQQNVVDRLLRSVSEGLVYVTLIEESLNATDEYVRMQKAAKKLWLEVDVYHKWLGNKLRKVAPQVITTEQILKWFRDTAEKMSREVENMDIESQYDNLVFESICASSMYRIAETILLSYNTNIEQVSQEDLFMELSSMIADILAACLTNLPQVIVMKCHETTIEKRVVSVQAAAQLLGETMQIINNLQDRDLPGLNPDEFPFIDKWRAYLEDPFP